jgi:hypothetical protein
MVRLRSPSTLNIHDEERLCRYIKSKADSMNCFEVHHRVFLKIFSELCYEHIHASSQKIVVFTPNIKQYLFALQDTVGMLAKKF